MNTPVPWITAAAASAALGVSRATLYSYVSRGFIRSQAMPGASRAHGYSREDVERLRRRAEERRHPERAAAHALQWGLPILESSIALIDGRRFYYRGHDAVMLATTRSIEEVASLIWLETFDARVRNVPAPAPREYAMPGRHPFIARAQALLASASAGDDLAGDVRAPNVARCGWRILQLLAAAATGSSATASTLDAMLAGAWGVSDRGLGVLRAALILCADHELNVSSFTARCVASAGSHPYAVVIAGLAALEGTRHGGASARAEALLAALRRERSLRRAVAARLRRGEALDGFGHPLYAAGDPRATALLRLLGERYPASPELAFVADFAQAAAAALRERPNIDFALAAVARVLRLPAGAPLMLFALGRTIGWIGHAIEQYATGQLIRPRAKYVGIVPSQ